MSDILHFTRTADGYQAWFALKAGSGLIRTGALPGNFTVTVINPGDTASTTPAVAESTTKAGIYKFTIPSSFFTTHGVGEYGVVIEVNVPGPSPVRDVFSGSLVVSLEDFDSLGIRATQVAYSGAVHIDTKNGAPGAVVGTNGTIDNPVSNLADAVTLAAALGLRNYTLVGNITLVSAHDDWVIEGRAAEAAVNFGGQDVAGSAFRNCQLSGTIAAGPIQAEDCDLDGVGNFTGHAHQCALVNGTTLGAGTSTFHHCFSAVPGLSTPSLDLNGTASLSLRAYSGGIELFNVSAPAQNVTLEFVAGQAILGPTNTDGVVTLRGVGNLTDTSGGTTIERNAFLNLDAIWDEVQDGTIAARTIMRRINAMARGRITLTGATTKPAQDAVYYDESGIPIYTNRNTGDERNPL